MAIARLRSGLLVLAQMSCTSPNPAFHADDGSGASSSVQADAITATTQLHSDATTSAASGSGGATSAGPTSADPASTDDAPADSTTDPLPATSTGEVEPLRALLVTQTGDAGLPLDATLLSALQDMGMEVELVEDLASTATDAQDVDVVVVSETASWAEVGAKFRDVPRPVVALESGIWGDMAMAPAGAWVVGTTFAIVDPAHPIAAGLEGEVQVLVVDFGSGMSPTIPPETAQIIARTPGPGPVTVFAYAAGDPMMGGVLAPAARVGLGFDVDAGGLTSSTADLTPQGVQMFVAAIEWCTQ